MESKSPEQELNELCRLIDRGTHVSYRDADNKLFVRDVNLVFHLSDLMGFSQAQETSRDAYEAEDGCLTCPLYPRCMPTPDVLIDTPYAKVLVPVLLTSFD